MPPQSSIWQDLLLVFGGNATLLIVLGFLFRSLLSQLLTKDVEKFKTQLKADADKSVEQYKSALQITALEHQVRFSKLHEKRAQVVADLYKRVVFAYWAAHTYHQWFEQAGGPTKEAQAESALESLRHAYRFFEVNRIYLTDALSGQLDNFFARAKTLTFKAQFFEAIPNKTEHTAQLTYNARLEGLQAFQEEFPAMRERLDSEFKRLIAADESKSPLAESQVI